MRYALRTSLLASLAAMIEVAVGQVQPTDTLQIYVIDVEGGGATLFVAPGGQSLLIDTGNGGAAAQRDAGRIMTAIEDAGLDAIDTLI
ncbi:MAG TPA: MBL fold metallo-hydrolase, partial [Gammaproteobacteria bacterium]|nr:MBL fold metallo-hydrolase [Gammaproteobacteria bacterium]